MFKSATLLRIVPSFVHHATWGQVQVNAHEYHDGTSDVVSIQLIAIDAPNKRAIRGFAQIRWGVYMSEKDHCIACAKALSSALSSMKPDREV